MDGAAMMTRHKISADDYYRMIDAGILGSEDKVELIEGEIIDMAPIGQDHEAAVNGMNRALVLACGDKAIVSVQNSIRLDASSVPQPDFAVFLPRADFYRTGTRPGPAETLLLVEIAKTSIRYDRRVKLPLYARAGIAEYWIADLGKNLLDAYRHPDGERYTERKTYGPSDSLPLVLAPDIVVPLALALG